MHRQRDMHTCCVLKLNFWSSATETVADREKRTAKEQTHCKWPTAANTRMMQKQKHIKQRKRKSRKMPQEGKMLQTQKLSKCKNLQIHKTNARKTLQIWKHTKPLKNCKREIRLIHSTTEVHRATRGSWQSWKTSRMTRLKLARGDQNVSFIPFLKTLSAIFWNILVITSLETLIWRISVLQLFWGLGCFRICSIFLLHCGFGSLCACLLLYTQCITVFVEINMLFQVKSNLFRAQNPSFCLRGLYSRRSCEPPWDPSLCDGQMCNRCHIERTSKILRFKLEL